MEAGSVATSGPSNAPIQQRQRRCHLSTEAPLRLLFPQTAAPAGGGGAEGAGPAGVGGGCAPDRPCALPTGLQGAPLTPFCRREAEPSRA